MALLPGVFWTFGQTQDNIGTFAKAQKMNYQSIWRPSATMMPYGEVDS